MSRIIPKLNLNKTPQLVENNSLIMAKNIRLLEDGTIGPDTSLEEIETKIGDSEEHIIHHDEITKTITDYKYTILDCDNTIDYYNDPTSMDDVDLDDVSFDFKDYCPIDSDKHFDLDSNTDKYVEESYLNNCVIYCYNLNNEELYWSREKFTYNPNENELINNNGYRLYLAIYEDYFDEKIEPPVGSVNIYYYVVLPKLLLGETIIINKFSFIVVNPVYPTNETETIVVSPAYDETVIHYNTLKYIGQIVGLNNKIYFFKEKLTIKFSQQARDSIRKKYPNECFVGETPLEGQIVTFDVNDDNDVTRRGEPFEDRDVAEDITISFNDRVKIYEFDEITKVFKIVKCAWHYSGGKINGCVTVNGTGEPILTICEYDVPNDVLVPIKHINLARCKNTDDETQYTQTPNIPISNLFLQDLYYKNIPAGVYQFFIRYKIHDEFYTNWFPCSQELFAGSKKGTNTLQGSLNYIDLHEDSNYSFVFRIEHLYENYCNKFEEYQLGFIISTEGGVFARSWKHFKMNLNASNIIYFDYNKEDVKEINIDDLLKTNFDIFNVGNIVPFKNKLYISNYKETDFNEDLNSYAKQIEVKLKLQDVSFDDSSAYFNDIPLHESDIIEGILTVYDSFGATQIKDTFGELMYCDIRDSQSSINKPRIERRYYDYNPTYGQVYGPTYSSPQEEFYPRLNRVYINYNNTNYYIKGSSNVDVNEQIDLSNTDNIINSIINEIRNNVLGIDKITSNYKININNAIIDISNINIEYTVYEIVYDSSLTDTDPYDNVEQTLGGWYIYPTTYTLKRDISLKDGIITNNISTRVRRKYNTLLPFTKYDFYVHYVKQNGVVSNGYFICTKEITRYCKGYTKSNRVSEPYKTLTDISNLDDISIYNPTDEDYARYYDSDLGDYVWYYMEEEDISEKNIIYPSFDNIICPPGYVSCFITISKYGNNIAQGFNHVTDTKQEKHILDCLELDCLLYNVLNNITVYDNKGTILTKDAIYYSSSTTNPVEHLGCSGRVEFNETITESTKFWISFGFADKPYTKNLIKITPFIKLNKNNSVSYDDYENLNIPGYACDIKKLNRDFCDALTVDNQVNNTGYYVSGTDVYTRHKNEQDELTLIEVDDRVDYHLSNEFFILSNFNLNFVSLTEDLNPVIRRFDIETVLGNEGGEIISSEKQYITLVNSLICSFILELKSIYRDYTRKIYSVYNKNNITEFNNTIRCSNIDVDEVYRYIHRFEATDYYNVPTQRGIIVNLISISNSVYVHCEHSLFKFTDNKTLNAESEEVTLQENDIFNSGITEVFDAQYGYAGLKKREHSLITFNAYVFYDEVAKTIYAFGGEQQIGSISQSIKKLIDGINIIDVRFLGDELHNRFFVNLITKHGNVCLSFNFNAKSFISIHDINFDFGFHTRRNTYLIHKHVYNGFDMGWSIYRIADVVRTLITRTDHPIPDTEENSQYYKNNYIAYQSCYKQSLIHIPDCDNYITFDEINSANACVDVICNTEYEVVKTLNYISWICSEVQQYGRSENNVSEEIINRHYPAHKIRIYSDSTETSLFALLDSNGNPKIANENRNIDSYGNIRPNSRNWQYPQYNCGIWSMNYFRDIKNCAGTNPNCPDIFDYTDAENDLNGDIGDSETTNLTPYITREYLTQENSLLYGKYFVVRFIFNNRNFKLENLILRMSNYGKTK